MRFPDPPRKRPSEQLLPMINVVFLLLIFFLLAAKLAGPEPFAITPPEAAGARPDDLPEGVFFLGAKGQMAYAEARGEAALSALAEDRRACAPDCAPLVLRADGGVSGAALAALLPRLSEAGVARVSLLSRAR